MKLNCNACDLCSKMENQRTMLNNLIIKKNFHLIDEEIVIESQVLDNLVCQCVFCEKSLNNFCELNLKDIFGTHSSFYYYGEQHLFSNMYFYITEGINSNELIYISMEENLYNKLIDLLKINAVSVEYIKFIPVKELIESNAQGGLTQLKEKLNNICLENEVKDFNGIRWIGQPTYAIQTTSQEAFLNWETNLSEALKNTNASLLCVYDSYDYMNNRKFINETVIKKSLETHTYILKNSALEKIN